MSLERTIKRNILKNELKTNKISGTWRHLQLEKYGIEKWLEMYGRAKC